MFVFTKQLLKIVHHIIHALVDWVRFMCEHPAYALFDCFLDVHLYAEPADVLHLKSSHAPLFRQMTGTSTSP
jgi:hypothetical protein